ATRGARDGGTSRRRRARCRAGEPRAVAAIRGRRSPHRWSHFMLRVVLVLADGLRPDAITPTDMPSLDALARELTRGCVSSQVVASELLPAYRAVLWVLTKAAGLGKYRS